jgi:putative transposase
MQQAVAELAPSIGVAQACRVLGVPRVQYYRALQPRPAEPAQAPGVAATARSPRALSPAERDAIHALLNSERFVDLSPREIYATLLDEGVYVCSWPTMYRILREHAQTTRRRDLVVRGAYAKPELLATAPRELWSWDITKLKGPIPWTYYYLYVIIDVFSRYVVGWMIAERESAELAEAFIAETCIREQIAPQQLTIHADRGAAMTSKTVAQLLSDLGVAKTHSRPSVSNDNPFSEAQFKTLKYHPSDPERFGSLLDARAWAREFFPWYNEAHHHTALGLLTPAIVHQGQVTTVLAARQAVLERAYQAHPERFVRGAPQPSAPPVAVWINPPTNAQAAPSSVFAGGGADSPEPDGSRAAVKGGHSASDP